VLKDCLPILFADDSNLCHASNVEDFPELNKKINRDLDATSKYMARNGLYLNLEKCKYIVFTPKKYKYLANEVHIHINGEEATQCDSLKFLCVEIDNELKWTAHITTVSRKVNYKLATLNQVLQHCNQENAKLLVNAMCISLVRYCCSVWGTANKSELNILNKCVRRCARSVFSKNKFENIDNEIVSLGWFYIDNLYKYSICVFTYCILHDLCPNYFHDFVKLKTTSYATRYPNHIHIPNPMPIWKYSKNLIAVDACRFWNNLPPDLTSCTTLRSFKLFLKNHILSITN